MLSDIDVLTLLKDRTSYEKFYPFIKDNLLTKEGDNISRYIDTYYTEDVLKSISTIDWGQFGMWFLLKQPKLMPNQRDIYKKVFESLDGYKAADDAFTKRIMEALTFKTYASKIAKEAMGIADGSIDSDLSHVGEIVKECQDTVKGFQGDVDQFVVTNDFDVLFAKDPNNPKLHFYLNGLKESVGDIGKGNFVVVAAHPDSGKTTFLLSEAANMVRQLPDDKLVVYFSNEQYGRDMRVRLISAITGLSIADVLADIPKAKALYDSIEGNRIKLIDQGYMTNHFVVNELEKRKDKVGLIMIDQLWKVHGNDKSKNEFMQLAHQFAWARELAKEYAPLITVHQLSGEASSKKYISMQDMFGSRVAIQGEADAIITIGRVSDGSLPHNVRHFHVPKNKLGGNNPTARNIKFDAYINHDLVKFEDIK